MNTAIIRSLFKWLGGILATILVGLALNDTAPYWFKSKTSSAQNGGNSALTPAPSPGDAIIGTWKQYQYRAGVPDWEISTFTISKKDGNYAASIIDQSQATNVEDSMGIYDIRSDGNTWTFNSNWGQGRVGTFNLRKKSDTVYEGEIFSEGIMMARVKMVRVGE